MKNQMWQPGRDWQRCPYCDSDEIEGSGIDIDTTKQGRPQARQFLHCAACGRGWDETYWAKVRATYPDERDCGETMNGTTAKASTVSENMQDDINAARRKLDATYTVRSQAESKARRALIAYEEAITEFELAVATRSAYFSKEAK